MSKERENRIILERSAALFMALVCAISLLAIAGWLFNLPLLATFRPEFIPMAPSTALILLGLSSAGLVQRVSSAKPRIRILVQVGLLGMSIIVLLLALRSFTGLGPDLEKLLLPNPGLVGEIESGRISPLTVLGFFLAIPALFLLTWREPAKNVSAALALILFVFSGLILLSYLYGVPLFYGGTLIPVAATTALSFLLLSLGLLLTAGPTCWPIRMYVGPSLKARLMRAIMPASIMIVLLQGLLSSAGDPWIINPALKVAVAALVATLVFIFIITLIAQNVSTEIERGNQARMIAESTLHQSEARLRALVEAASDAIINIDRAGQIVFWNRAAETIFGYSAGEVLGKPLGLIMPPEFRADHQQGMQRFASTGESQIIGKTIEIVGQRKDGRQFPLALSLAAWQVDGELFFTGIGRDITEQRQVELALIDERNLLVTLMDNVPDMIYFKDLESHFIRTNQAHARRLGLNDPAESVGKTDFDLFGEEHARQAYEDEQAIIRTGQPLVAKEEKETFLDGHILWVSTTKMPLRSRQGQIIGTFGISRDITDRKQAEEALRKSESSLQAILSSTADGILAVGSENEILYTNARFTEIWRIPPEIMANKNDSTLIGHVLDQLTDPQVFLNTIQDLYKSIEESFDILNFKDGRVFERLSHPLMEGTLVRGRVWSFRDITQRVRLEEEIRSLSLTDELTGLYNRRGFTLLAEQELKQAHRDQRALLLFFGDVDNLKTINDTWGHARGDVALQEIAAILKENLRESDILARIGGDEFVALALAISQESGEIIKNRIQAALDARNRQNGETYLLAFSLGVARFDPETPCTMNELIAQADGLMYQEKQARKGKP